MALSNAVPAVDLCSPKGDRERASAPRQEVKALLFLADLRVSPDGVRALWQPPSRGPQSEADASVINTELTDASRIPNL